MTAASILNTVAKAVDKRRQGQNGQTNRLIDRQRVTLIGSQEASTTISTTTTRVPGATTMRKITVSKITTTNMEAGPKTTTATTFDDAIEADSVAG